MFTTKLNLFAPLALAVIGAIIASTLPALAGDFRTPAPIVGAGLPLVVGGGYWLIRKLRERR